MKALTSCWGLARRTYLHLGFRAHLKFSSVFVAHHPCRPQTLSKYFFKLLRGQGRSSSFGLRPPGNASEVEVHACRVMCRCWCRADLLSLNASSLQRWTPDPVWAPVWPQMIRAQRHEYAHAIPLLLSLGLCLAGIVVLGRYRDNCSWCTIASCKRAELWARMKSRHLQIVHVSHFAGVFSHFISLWNVKKLRVLQQISMFAFAVSHRSMAVSATHNSSLHLFCLHCCKITLTDFLSWYFYVQYLLSQVQEKLRPPPATVFPT